ncbi:hypothetical protein P0F65_02935 [Sphingomonas sp. I4]
MLDRIALLMTELKVATDGLAHDLRSPHPASRDARSGAGGES